MEYSNDTIRQMEKDSIWGFVEDTRDLMRGRTLDYGCGLQPYRTLVELEPWPTDYTPYDRMENPGSVVKTDVGPDHPLSMIWDTIICNQVVQYVPDVQGLLGLMKWSLNPGGYLLMTYPTTWAEVEPEDLHRFTRSGMQRMLSEAGFFVERHEQRGAIDLGGFRLALGYGVAARA